MIGIIGAMAIEVENLKGILEDKTTRVISGIEFCSGKISGRSVVIAQCGIGKVFAAVCAQTMILNYGVDTVINTGVAGTLTRELSVCDIAISDKVVQHDMDTSPIGDPVGLLSGINVVELPCDKELVAKAEAVIGNMGFRFKTGIIATGDQFVATEAQKERILKSFDAIACEMEGGAIGHVAYINNVKFIALRAISDGADGEAQMDYPTFLKTAAANSTRVTLGLIEKI